MKFLIAFILLWFSISAHAYLPDHSIAKVKIGPWQGAISSSSGLFATSSTSLVDVTNLTVTLTTYGRPVMLQLINATSALGVVTIGGSSSTTDTGTINFNTGLVILGSNSITAGLGTSAAATPCSAFSVITSAIAGTHTFKVQAQTSAVTNFQITNCQLIAYEL